MPCASCGLDLSYDLAGVYAPCCYAMICCGQTPWACANDGLCDVSLGRLSCDLDDNK